MDKSSNTQIFILVFSGITTLIAIYTYFSTEEQRSIQKEIDKLRLADMKKKIAAGVGINDPLPT